MNILVILFRIHTLCVIKRDGGIRAAVIISNQSSIKSKKTNIETRADRAYHPPLPETKKGKKYHIQYHTQSMT